MIMATALATQLSPGQPAPPFHLMSTSFEHNGPIPVRYTCDGDNASPELHWTNTPAGTMSFVLIMDDPDAPDPRAPRTKWVHWVLYNLPPELSALSENIDGGKLPPGALAGMNDARRAAYDGPCPPVGRHRYFFKLYALDAMLPDLHQPTKARVESAMKGHVLAEALLIGTYRKQRL